MGIWKSISEGIADFAPSIAKTILPGPIGGIASLGIKALTDMLGLTDEESKDPEKIQSVINNMTPEIALALKKEEHGFKIKMKELNVDLEKQTSERHKNDMLSDSWLSKNVRPMVLVFLTISTVLYVFACVFWVSPARAGMAKAFVPLFITLDVTVYSFYFGGREITKIKKIGIK